ncbi:MAG: hypothetical protein SW833_13775 [Cyanobacteriota bacterium]|nr:hypothetical protein [Cyanobacteriota bacterium]
MPIIPVFCADRALERGLSPLVVRSLTVLGNLHKFTFCDRQPSPN